MSGNALKVVAHRISTMLAFDLLNETSLKFPLISLRNSVAEETVNTDYRKDLEFIWVLGGLGSGGRDNPHKDDTWAIDDKSYYDIFDFKFTAFNHFIDIRNGPGRFDDFDGYSYYYGSASKDEYENISSTANSIIGGDGKKFLRRIIKLLAGDRKTDNVINTFLSFFYVHAPGRKWYKTQRPCSPSITNYSFYSDKGKYSSIVREAKKRFPLTDSTGGTGQGIPWSIFFPVDNLARFHYDNYLKTKDIKSLGSILHAIQDASIPHHAAGCMGNWHTRYEKDMKNQLKNYWQNEENFKDEITDLFQIWLRNTNPPPIMLGLSDYNKTPGFNWKIHDLVTWLALNAYYDYKHEYDNFMNGYKTKEKARKNLTKKAIAISMLTLLKVSNFKSAIIS